MRRRSPAKAPLAGALLFVLLAAVGAPAAETARVERVLDGDSLLLDDGRQLRLIGVNAPEFGRSCHDDARGGKDCVPTPDQPLARESRELVVRLVDRQPLRLEPGPEPTDRHGRLLAHAFLPDGTNVEEQLLRAGLAWMVAIPPNVERVDALMAAEAEARNAGLGVWSVAAFRPLPAERLDSTDGGFRIVAGRIGAVRGGRHSYYLQLAPQSVIVIARSDWDRYFARRAGYPTAAQGLTGRRVTVRAWVSVRDGERRLRVGHPAMLTFGD